MESPGWGPCLPRPRCGSTPRTTRPTFWSGAGQLAVHALLVQLPVMVFDRMAYNDLGWPLCLLLLGLHGACLGPGAWRRRLGMGGCYVLHGLRMAVDAVCSLGGMTGWTFIFEEDLARYQYARESWVVFHQQPPEKWWAKRQWDSFQQGMSTICGLAVPMLLSAWNPTEHLHPLELLGWGLWISFWALENLADRQKRLFLLECRRLDAVSVTEAEREELRAATLGMSPWDGSEFWLWTRCRHPNYFGEWMCWVSLSLAAVPSLVALASRGCASWRVCALALLLLHTPRMFYDCLVHWTGAAAAEHFSVRKRPAYREYQRTVRCFFPVEVPFVDHHRQAGWPRPAASDKDLRAGLSAKKAELRSGAARSFPAAAGRLLSEPEAFPAGHADHADFGGRTYRGSEKEKSHGHIVRFPDRAAAGPGPPPVAAAAGGPRLHGPSTRGGRGGRGGAPSGPAAGARRGDPFPPPFGLRADTYFSGKMLARLARLVVIADELGEAKESYFSDMVKRLTERIEVWLREDAEAPFVYDAAWGGLVSCGCLYDDCEGECGPRCANAGEPASSCPALEAPGMNFGNGYYNDHHFHYGYFVYSAAVAAKYAPKWEEEWREQILALVRDYANPSAEDPHFPVARHKDWFLGISWAGGIPQAYENGRNQESTSEAIHSYYACVRWSHYCGRGFFNGRRRQRAAGLTECIAFQFFGSVPWRWAFFVLPASDVPRFRKSIAARWRTSWKLLSPVLPHLAL
ncbi:unnamed protein product, partial [Prorocentrum cordatum]